MRGSPNCNSTSRRQRLEVMRIIVIGGANLDIKSVIAGKTVAATEAPRRKKERS